MPKKKILIIRSDKAYEQLFTNKSYKFDVLDEHNYDEEPDVIVFTGGPDVSPELYGEKQLRCTFPDKKVEELYKEVYDRHPNAIHLGICFGGQWLNVINGGAMWQDISNHAVGRTHQIRNLLRIANSPLVREVWDVTSTHHQMMIAGPDSEILAIAVDPFDKNKGMSGRYITAKEGGRDKPKFDTEVVYYPKTKSLCFQPHPEFHNADNCRAYFYALIDHLFDL